MKRKAVILLVFSLSIACYPQENYKKAKADSLCFLLISQAEENYNAGLYLDCLENIEQVLSGYELGRSEKIRTLELAAKASVETGEMGMADSYVSVMLKTFPHYDLKEQENSESFNRIVKKYDVRPVLNIGIRNTVNWMNYRTISIFSYDGLQYDVPYTKNLQGILNDFEFRYYGWAELHFGRNLSLNGDLSFKWIYYERELTKGPPSTLSFSEQDNFVEISLYPKRYFHPWKNVMTYGTAGFGWLYMTRCTGDVSIFFTESNVTNAATIDMLPYRTRSSFEWIIGTGIGYKYRNLRMFIDARCFGGLNSITDPLKAAGDPVLLNDYRYIDNKFRLNQFELGASISYTLVNTVKKKKY